MKNKKGLSAIIATVLIILLVTAATAIVWAFVNNIINDQTEGVQSCFEVESGEKVILNDYYTCFDSDRKEVRFSITIADAEIDSLLVSIAAGGTSKSFTLNNTEVVVTNLRPYQGINGEAVNLPGQNEGKTYVAEGFSLESSIDSIKIAPIIGEKQCGMSDSTYSIEDCTLFAFD